VLAYCRAGFEGECAGELAATAGASGLDNGRVAASVMETGLVEHPMADGFTSACSSGNGWRAWASICV
jgi:23S rRNA C2498 (ribose-2'-O)-methylase RlmM